MNREMWYDVKNDSNLIRYSVVRLDDGMPRMFYMTFRGETREDIARAIWNVLRPAIRGLRPYLPGT